MHDLVVALVSAAGGTVALPAWQWLVRLLGGNVEREATRVGTLEDLVDALRRALDKGRVREDALAQVLGVLIFGLRQIEYLSPVLADAIERAIEILEKARGQLEHISTGGGAQ